MTDILKQSTIRKIISYNGNFPINGRVNRIIVDNETLIFVIRMVILYGKKSLVMN
jgi:hypothetical protein